MRWAASLGIVNGHDNGLFGAEDAILREQVVAILFRYAAQVLDTASMTTQELASDYALSAMNWALVRGIVQGADGVLLPQGSCSRAQIVTMLHRLR